VVPSNGTAGGKPALPSTLLPGWPEKSPPGSQAGSRGPRRNSEHRGV